MLEYCEVTWLKKRLNTCRITTVFQLRVCRLHTALSSLKKSIIKAPPPPWTAVNRWMATDLNLHVPGVALCERGDMGSPELFDLLLTALIKKMDTLGFSVFSEQEYT